jgi:hypothetical protein
VGIALDIGAALLWAAEEEDDEVVLPLEHADRPITAIAERLATAARLYPMYCMNHSLVCSTAGAVICLVR